MQGEYLGYMKTESRYSIKDLTTSERDKLLGKEEYLNIW